MFLTCEIGNDFLSAISSVRKKKKNIESVQSFTDMRSKSRISDGDPHLPNKTKWTSNKFEVDLDGSCYVCIINISNYSRLKLTIISSTKANLRISKKKVLLS
jgi:hypothetical protein